MIKQKRNYHHTIVHSKVNVDYLKKIIYERAIVSKAKNIIPTFKMVLLSA